MLETRGRKDGLAPRPLAPRLWAIGGRLAPGGDGGGRGACVGLLDHDASVRRGLDGCSRGRVLEAGSMVKGGRRKGSGLGTGLALFSRIWAATMLAETETWAKLIVWVGDVAAALERGCPREWNRDTARLSAGTAVVTRQHAHGRLLRGRGRAAYRCPRGCGGRSGREGRATATTTTAGTRARGGPSRA